MRNLIPLMQREWFQHRQAWALLLLVPVALALLLLSVGQIQLDEDMSAMPPQQLSALLAVLTAVISVGVILLVMGGTSLFNAISSPRRDHGDRSFEFWLSLPSGHAESLLAPMLVHLLIVPALAVCAGLLAAVPVSMVVVGRVAGFGHWWALPWDSALPALLAVSLRLLAGLPLAVLWLLPLVLAAMLANAFFRRWGLPVLVLAVGLVSVFLERILGQPLLVQAIGSLAAHAATSLIGASAHQGFTLDSSTAVGEALSGVPRWAIGDFGAALRDAAKPGFVAACAASAALFAALVGWRQRWGTSA